MYGLFIPKPSPVQGIMKYPAWPYVRDGLKRNLGQVISYYRRSTMGVYPEHFLVRLLMSIAIPQSLPPDRYYEHIDASAMNLARNLNMTSPVSYGQIFDGVFYGPGNSEILIADDATFDPLDATLNWRNLVPVKVLSHQRSDLGFNLPNGKRNGSEAGLAVIYINIPLLAIMYRAWRKAEIEASRGIEESQRTTMMFVHMYVLPNMMASHLDIALFNRFDRLYHGYPVGRAFRHLPIVIPPYELQVDQAYVAIAEYLERSPKDFRGTLQSIPAVSHTDMLHALYLPKLTPTRQVDWALTVSRVRALGLLADIDKNAPNGANRQEYNTLLREAAVLKRNGVLRAQLSMDDYDRVIEVINSITS